MDVGGLVDEEGVGVESRRSNIEARDGRFWGVLIWGGGGGSGSCALRALSFAPKMESIVLGGGDNGTEVAGGGRDDGFFGIGVFRGGGMLAGLSRDVDGYC